ncbi:DUF1804 domain-containing protein [Helicobacter suis]|uniref:DUF1804 domain-containing protein n=1 Tax=Helicobacter suis TaxID=104628 RepID=UPI0013D2455B|nr:DUF1804 domain-containing protein [Helicobacter suis]
MRSRKRRRNNPLDFRDFLIQHENIRSLYLQGKDLNYICTTLGIKKKDIIKSRDQALESGDDWDALLMYNKRNTQESAMSEAYFVARLIEGFETQLTQNPDLSLEQLAKYTRLYYTLKQPKNTDELRNKEQLHANTMRVIKIIADLALKQQNKAVVSFLSESADLIIKSVFKRPVSHEID